MNLIEEFKKETGFDAYVDNEMQPKVYTEYYVEWLEHKLRGVVKSFYCHDKNGGDCNNLGIAQCEECKKMEARQALLDTFNSWFDSKPNKLIMAAQCANIAEDYAEKQLRLHGVSISEAKLKLNR